MTFIWLKVSTFKTQRSTLIFIIYQVIYGAKKKGGGGGQPITAMKTITNQRLVNLIKINVHLTKIFLVYHYAIFKLSTFY